MLPSSSEAPQLLMSEKFESSLCSTILCLGTGRALQTVSMVMCLSPLRHGTDQVRG